ncbi:Bardet-Biedl syndrome 10 protein [Tachyglossus aculeatus]|uniref:Bardet-Biedl syndrome 10 protein n=1 Tax=Tachyglossus aculeatus TaxID=9261 RepID=UPI0018F30AA7|nr:Bardet-Biedl syndrome 10 protein [Tachyglossus aculeatus]
MEASASASVLEASLQVSEALESIVSRCLGPPGRQVLCVQPAGQALGSRDGAYILQALRLDHPLARMVVSCVAEHRKATGDGAKTFILLLCGLLRGLRAAAGHVGTGPQSRERGWSPGCRWKRISQTLRAFQAHVLDRIVAQHLTRHFLTLFSFHPTEAESCRAAVESLLRAYFCGRVGRNNQTFISQLCCDFFYKCMTSESVKGDTLRLIEEHFEELHSTVVGLPVSSSRVIEGVVLHRDFSVYCPGEGDTRMSIVTDPIQPPLSVSGSELVVNSEAQCTASQVWATERTRVIMRHLKSKKVRLLLSSVKQQDSVLYYAKLNGISVVDCLSLEEISLLLRVTGISPLVPSCTDLLCETPDVNAAVVKFCQPLLLSSQRCVHLGLLSQPSFTPHHAILCGPVQGLTEQLVSAFHGAFKMLRQSFKSLGLSFKCDGSDENPNEGPETLPPTQFPEERFDLKPAACERGQEDASKPKQGLGSLVKAGELECGVSNPVVTDEHRDEHRTRCDLEFQVCKDAIALWENGEPLISTQRNGNSNSPSGNTCKGIGSKQPRDIKHSCKMSSLSIGLTPREMCNNAGQTYSSSSIQAGSVLPVGGDFEILLHYYLLNYSRQCRQSEVTMVCSLIANALLTIPQNLNKTKKRFLQIHHIRTQQALLAESRRPALETGLESVACKYQLLSSVLHCFTKLLAIDLVISIKRQPQMIRDEDSDDEL